MVYMSRQPSKFNSFLPIHDQLTLFYSRSLQKLALKSSTTLHLYQPTHPPFLQTTHKPSTCNSTSSPFSPSWPPLPAPSRKFCIRPATRSSLTQCSTVTVYACASVSPVSTAPVVPVGTASPTGYASTGVKSSPTPTGSPIGYATGAASMNAVSGSALGMIIAGGVALVSHHDF
jgi:hypothetical protein